MHWFGEREFFVRSVSVDLITLLVYKLCDRHRWVMFLDASFKTLFNKIAAELCDKTHGKFELRC